MLRALLGLANNIAAWSAARRVHVKRALRRKLATPPACHHGGMMPGEECEDCGHVEPDGLDDCRLPLLLP